MCCSRNEYRSKIGLFTSNYTSKSKPPKTNTPLKIKITYTTLFLTIFTLMPLYPNTSYPTHKNNNKLQHILNGNSYLSLVHWNKGKSLFHNKLNDIDMVLDKFKPHIISLCEANIDKIINNTHNNKYHDYSIEHTKMADKTNISRNVILIKDGLVYKRRSDLEDDETSTVWIELKLPNSKPISITSIY